MTDIIHWKYEYMYNWYNKQDDNQVDNMRCIVYSAQRPKKKDTAHLECFVRHNITYIGKCPVQPIHFANGLYTIMDNSSSNRKWMFFVFPTEKDGIMFADHYSFCYDKSDHKKPVHFHITMYGKDMMLDPNRYIDRKLNDFMPDDIDMSRKGNVEEILKVCPAIDKQVVLDLMRRPWHRRPGTASTSSGGTRVQSALRIPNKPIVSQAFNTMWESIELKDITAFGFTNDKGEVTWNVSFNRKGRRPQGRLEDAYVFTTASDDEKTFQDTLASLVL
jgi:hypothetical protein